MSFERGKHRRMRVPKAGPLYVNGVQTKKGNVHQATKRVIAGSDRGAMFRPGQTAPIRLADASEIDGTCAACGAEPPHTSVALEVATGRWACMGTPCRREAFD